MVIFKKIVNAQAENRTRLTSLATRYSTNKLPTLDYSNNLKFDNPIILIPTISITMLKGKGTISKNNKVAEVRHIATPIIKRLMLIVLPVSILKNMVLKRIELMFARCKRAVLAIGLQDRDYNYSFGFLSLTLLGVLTSK